MSHPDKKEASSAILQAIRAKSESKTTTIQEIAQLEEALLADIEAFDLDTAEKNAHLEHLSHISRSNYNLAFPEIVPVNLEKTLAQKPRHEQVGGPVSASKPPPPEISMGTSLLAQLRDQAAKRQLEQLSADVVRNTSNEAIDQSLRQIFSYLHELVLQLNIVKPEIQRAYPLTNHHELNQFNWQEGFADYRNQSQSAGALVELTSLTYQLKAPNPVFITCNELLVERFRTKLFDYGLQFACKEFRNERHHVERAEFEIKTQLNVSARWRADFAHGKIILETRNLERLGAMNYQLSPEQVTPHLLDEFGRMVLGHGNQFRALLRRPF